MADFRFLFTFSNGDDSAEAKSLIDRYITEGCNVSVQLEKLGKYLATLIARPKLILEVFSQISQASYYYFMPLTMAQFAENLTPQQIQDLAASKYGSFLLNKIFNGLYVLPIETKQNVNILNRYKQLAMKIDIIRNPPNTNDSRPYIGDMVENNTGLQYKRYDDDLNRTWLLDQGDYRFGVGHDGEHMMGDPNGSRVKAIAGLTGTVLTYYAQQDGTYAVAILLNDNRNVLLLKDLINLSPLVLKAPCSTNIKGIPKFIDRAGKPISTVKIGVGETLGFTRKWTPPNKSGTGLHFTIVKFQFAQQFREFLPELEKQTVEDIKRNSSKGPELANKAYQQWLIAPCSAESPVRCR